MPVTCLLGWTLAAALPGPGSEVSDEIDHAFQFGEQQVAHAITYLRADEHARSTLADGTWRAVEASDWTSGFFAGCQWFMFEKTFDSNWRQRAMEQTADLEEQKDNTGDHDVGFRIMCSFGNGYRLTRDPAYLDVMLTAARSLSSRFDAAVGCIRSWDFGSWQFPVIIDNMMNLELLFWAAENGGSPEWHDMAVSHALRTMAEHVRPEGSTYHVVDFDPVSGDVLWKGTYQGYSDDSTWSRGQAWGLYGFTMAYRYTHDLRFLATAQRLADYSIAHLPADGIPYWDFEAPEIPDEPRDTSSAAIAASALLELAEHIWPPSRKALYRGTAEHILESLSSDAYLAERTPSDGILLHGVGHKPGDNEVDVSLIFGDYYFLEAIIRYRRGPVMRLLK